MKIYRKLALTTRAWLHDTKKQRETQGNNRKVGK